MASSETAARYRWADLTPDHPMDLLQRRRVIGRLVMLSEVRLQKGCVVPIHAHENEQICCVLSGRLRFGLGDEGSPQRQEIEVEGGEVLHLPSGVPHSAEALEQSLVIDVFSPVSEATGIDR
ncbi:MAG: cupin domain-containing protein [Planctomycetota bacterium]|jgi:quercetin dioxygenase-like cupin family protein